MRVLTALVLLLLAACSDAVDSALRPSDQPLERLLTADAKAAAARAAELVPDLPHGDAANSVCVELRRIADQGQLILEEDQDGRVVVDADKWGRLPDEAKRLIEQCLGRTADGKKPARVRIIPGVA